MTDLSKPGPQGERGGCMGGPIGPSGQIPGAKVVRQLAPGLFAVGDELHLDLPVFVASLGWDPADEKAQEMAIAVMVSIAEEHGIPIEVTE